MLTGMTLTKPSLHLHTMTVSSTSGTQRPIHLHRNIKNLTFAKLMNFCTHQNKQRNRISRNIRYSAVNSSQKKIWICLLLLVSLSECCFVYMTDSVIVMTSVVVFCIRVHTPKMWPVLLICAFVSYWLFVATSCLMVSIKYRVDITVTLLTVVEQIYYLIFLAITKFFVILCNILLGFMHFVC